MSQKIYLMDFQRCLHEVFTGVEKKIPILSHPVTSKQPHKIVQNLRDTLYILKVRFYSLYLTKYFI